MDASVLVDLPAWLSWTTAVLYGAGLCLAVIVIALVSCVIGQIMPAVSHSDARKRRTGLAH